MEPLSSTHKKLIGLSRLYTTINAIYIVPVSALLCAILVLRWIDDLLFGLPFSLDPPRSPKEYLWLGLWVAGWVTWVAHSIWRTSNQITTMPMSPGTPKLWAGSVLLNSVVICCHVFQLIDHASSPVVFKYCARHLAVLILPVSALVPAVLGLRESIRTKPLHNRCRLLS